MQDTEFAAFGKALGTVAVAFSRDLDDATIDLYFKALREIPLELIQKATADIVKFEERWPTPAKWRVIVDDVQERLGADEQKALAERQQKLLPAPVFDTVTNEWVQTYHCYKCKDTGWRPDCGCDADQMVTIMDLVHAENLKGLGTCKVHGPRRRHELDYPRSVYPCECRPTNPVWQQKYPTTKPKYSRPKTASRRQRDAD